MVNVLWYGFLSLLPHIIGQHEDTSERLTGQQPPYVNETLPTQQPSQASGVATPTMQNQLTSPIAASKFGKQSISVINWSHTWCSIVQFGLLSAYIDVNGRVCGALVQFDCYQHRHK